MANTKASQVASIIFEDFNSSGDQHLSGNASLIKQFSCISKADKCKLVFRGNEEYSANLQQFCESRYGIALHLSTSIPRTSKSTTIVLYPKYKLFLSYILRKITGEKLIAVNHGHFNSYSDKLSIKSAFKNLIKTCFFLVFENVIVYSGHIKANMSNKVSAGPFTNNIVVISEIIFRPVLVPRSVDYTDRRQIKISIGFREPLTVPQHDILSTLITKIKNPLTLCKMNNLDLNTYFERLHELDFLILPKNYHYRNQVSGVINDCFSYHVLPIGTSFNEYLKYMFSNFMGYENLLADDPSFDKAIALYLKDPGAFWRAVDLFLAENIAINSHAINSLVRGL